jgi:uncharacterized C2H2 Zn-finger protein
MSSEDEAHFDCGVCGASFRKQKHLRYHQDSVHCTSRRFVCQECGNAYKRSTHLRRHVQNAHSENAAWVCTWESCGKSLSATTKLMGASCAVNRSPRRNSWNVIKCEFTDHFRVLNARRSLNREKNFFSTSNEVIESQKLRAPMNVHIAMPSSSHNRSFNPTS